MRPIYLMPVGLRLRQLGPVRSERHPAVKVSDWEHSILRPKGRLDSVLSVLMGRLRIADLMDAARSLRLQTQCAETLIVPGILA